MARRAWVVVGLWAVFIVVGYAAAMGAFGNDALFSKLHSGEITAPGENAEGRALLERGGSTGFSTYTLLLEGVDLRDPAVARAATMAARDLAGIEHVTSVANPYVAPGGPTGTQGSTLVGEGGVESGRFATVVTFDQSLTRQQESAARAEVDAVFDTLATATEASGDQRGGVRQLVDRVVDQIQVDAQRGEGIALPISFAIMVVVFGGFLAAGMPIIGAIASIAGALLSLLGFSHLLELDATVVNVVTVLGLGLCIDYGLLVVSRFREEARGLLSSGGGQPPADPDGRHERPRLSRDEVHVAIERTLDRAGRTVVFSAVTVAISLLGLVVFDIEFIRAVAAAGISVVLVALAVALSLVPALCALGARRILRKGTESSGDHGIFASLAAWVHRVPWLVIVGVGALLVVLAVPALSLRLTSSGAELLPKGTPERTFFETLAEDYPGLSGAQVTVVTEAPVEEVAAWAPAATRLEHVTRVDPPRELDHGVVALGLHVDGGGSGDAARELTQRLRDPASADRPPFEAKVVGQASGLVDFRDAVVERAPWAILLVCLATLVLLFLMTGSLVIPLKALVMNVLSLGASLGAIVWVFQDGHLEGLLRFDSVGAIENAIPLLVLAFGFGLSMDYEVFLLSRIVELHEQGHDTRTAVSLGLQRSGRIITSAALLMMIVFAGFAAGELLIIKQMGVALVLAILIDATLVRMLLVPATMAVLGRRNWWAPSALKSLHARWGITE